MFHGHQLILDISVWDVNRGGSRVKSQLAVSILTWDYQ